MTRTEEVLLAMLRENTGRHFLDSGGEHGRRWQSNQTRDLLCETAAVVTFRHWSIEFEHRTLHWLCERLEVDDDANEAFDDQFLEEKSQGGDEPSWYELRETFPEWFARWRGRGCEAAGGGCESEPICGHCDGSGSCDGEENSYSATGIYGDGQSITVNTYNEDNLLDQVLLFTYFELRAGAGRGGCVGVYVVLQVHGGCDVRGGYTRPRVFRVTRDEGVEIFDYRRGTIFCRGGEHSHRWTTDDGGAHWYFEGACGRGSGPQLERYEWRTISAHDGWEPGFLCVNDDGGGFCPLCGSLLAGAE
jgi:hypothetical protein